MAGGGAGKGAVTARTGAELVAAALGGHGELVEAPEQLGWALARAAGAGLPACVNVVIDGVAAPTYRANAPAQHRLGPGPPGH
jgi:acetolactate synthase-1/2/3 large subunit